MNLYTCPFPGHWVVSWPWVYLQHKVKFGVKYIIITVHVCWSIFSTVSIHTYHYLPIYLTMLDTYLFNNCHYSMNPVNFTLALSLIIWCYRDSVFTNDSSKQEFFGYCEYEFPHLFFRPPTTYIYYLSFPYLIFQIFPIIGCIYIRNHPLCFLWGGFKLLF